MIPIETRLALTRDEHWLLYYLFVEGKTQAGAANAVGVALHTAVIWLNSIRHRASAATKDGKRVNNTQLAYLAGKYKLRKPSQHRATAQELEVLSWRQEVARDEVARLAALAGVSAPP
jgi:transposase